MIGLSKSITFTKSASKVSKFDSDEFITGGGYGNDTGAPKTFAQKLAISGLTFHQMDAMYVANSWVRGIVDKIIERVCNIKPIVKPVKANPESGQVDDATKKNIDVIQEFLVNPNTNNESLLEIRKKYVRDILKYDAAGIEIVSGTQVIKGTSQKLIEIYSVAGETIKLNPDRRGIYGDNAFIQVDRGLRPIATWSKDELIYFMMNPQANRVYGLSPLESLVQTVTADLYTGQYNLDFYYNNATPRYAVLLNNMGLGQGNAAMSRFREWWEKELKGQPHKPIILGTENGEVKIQTMGMSNNEMEFYKYSMWLLSKIMVVYKMQPAVLAILTEGSVKSGD